MSGGGKSSTSTSSVSIPPEVLARYNAVNARAEDVAQQGFTSYGGEFVAPLTQTQQAGISNVSQAAGAAQPYYQAASTSLLGGAAQAQPYYQGATEALYGGQAAAAPLQTAAAQNISGAQAAAQPYQDMATGFGLAGARQIAPGGLNVGAYMSPYTESVAQPTYQALRQQQQQEQQKIVGDQVRSGAFGGDRGKIAQAVLAQQQNLATGQAMGNIYQQGYGQALGAAQQQQGVALQTEQSNRQAQQQAANQFLGIGQQAFGQGSQAAQQQAALGAQVFGQGAQSAQTQQALGQGLYNIGAGVSQGLAGLGTGAQQAGLQGGQAQLAAGTVEQQTQQANNQAQYNQFLQQQGYPFQVAQFLANIAMGTGALSGSTTTTQQPSSFFSDERLKEDVEPIGKTFDGQKIVRFKYKGEPGTRIGLVAQDVEKKHPEAVGLAGGYKTVDYDAATDEAAARAPKAYGGGLSPWDGNSMGGSVFREDAGAGFAAGGAPGGDDVLAQINALVNSHQGMYPYGKAGMYGSGMGKAGPYGSTLMQPGSRGLMRAENVGPRPVSAMEGIESTVRRAENIGKIYQGAKGGLEAIKEQTSISPEYAAATYGPQLPNAPAAQPRTARDYFESYTGNRGFAGEPPVPEPAPGVARGGAIRPGLAMGGLPYSQAEDEHVPEDVSKPMDAAKLQTASTGPMKDQGAEDAKTAMQMASTIASIYAASDRRLKDNIEPIGKLFDGQKVYRYNLKGDDKTQIGLMAQEVEKRHPDAVGLAPRKGYQPGGEVTASETGLTLPEGYLDYLSGRESSGRPDATNQAFPPERGGPVGRHQFTARTFLDMARNDPRFEGKSEAEILAERTNPVVSTVFADRLARENAPVLQRAGFELTRENLALAHMQGATGATALLSNPERNAVDVLTDVYGNRDQAMTVLAQNRGDPTMTSAQFAAHLTGARAQATGVAPPNAQAEAALATSVAPPNAQAEAATGLGGQPVTPKEKDWFGRNESWIMPLVTGLGTMASSPSRYLGSAVLQGLMGAGQAAQQNIGLEGQRLKVAEETKKIASETGRTAAQSQEIYARIAASAESPDRRTVRIFRNGRFILIPREEFWRNPSTYSMYAVPYSEDERRQFSTPPGRGEPSPGGARPPASTTAPPDGADRVGPPPSPDGRQNAAAVPPSNVPTTRSVEGDITLIPALTEETRNLADREASRTRQYSPNELPAVAERTRDVFNPGRARAASASASLSDRVNLAKEFMALPDTDWGSLGRTTQFVTPILAWVNSTLNTFNVPDPRNPGQTLQFNADRLARLEALDKEAIQNALRQQGESGGRAYRELEQILSATPNTRMSRQSVEKILATNFSAEQRSIDFDNYLNLWRNYVTEPRENAVGINENELRLTGPQAEREFERLYGAQFVKEKAGIERILGTTVNGKPLIDRIVESQGRPSRQMIDYMNQHFANEGGARLLRYFYGR